MFRLNLYEPMPSVRCQIILDKGEFEIAFQFLSILLLIRDYVV